MADEESILDRLAGASSRDLYLFLPLLLGIQPTISEQNLSMGTEESDGDGEGPTDRLILINPFTQGMMVIEGSSTIRKKGYPPASRASIEAMPEAEMGEDGECVICLEELVVGVMAKEMPCKHKFHSGCIVKWLGVRGSCPVCRYEMPEDETGGGSKGDGAGDEGQRRRREIWLSFSFGSSNDSGR